MKYIDVYKKRVEHLGTNPQRRAMKSGILEFSRSLRYNEHTQRGLHKDGDSLTFDGIVLTNKEDDNKSTQILLTELDVPLACGDIVIWNDERWLVYQYTTSSYQPYQKFFMVRCNYEIKWVDEEGEVRKSWCYLLGSKDSKIKDNFRTWNEVITPQPNKYIQLILPHTTMAINTEIIVLDEAWYLVDYDQNSVPGIVFMSFTETNTNELRDDIENKIANADKIAAWTIVSPSEQYVLPHSEVALDYVVQKNGIVVDEKPEISISGSLVEQDGKIFAAESGEGQITFSIHDQTFTQTIHISTSPSKQPMVIFGDDKIRVSMAATYELQGADQQVVFSVSDTKMATVETTGQSTCLLTTNSKNLLGSVDLIATCGEEVYTKTIKIIPIWQVI